MRRNSLILLKFSCSYFKLASHELKMPQCVRAAWLGGQQSIDSDRATCRQLLADELDVLFVAPERLARASFVALLKRAKISFACIDEAHCVTAWSHNFRPSYLRLRQTLCDELGVTTLLAMTATATRATQRHIAHALGFELCDEVVVASDIATMTSSMNTTSSSSSSAAATLRRGVVVRQATSRRNLLLSASIVNDRHTALLDLLGGELVKARAIIVYATMKHTVDAIVAQLAMAGHDAAPYHTDRTASERARVQQRFMSGKLRIVVATVAFGMGLNKADVDAVVHFNMPRSLEHYVQETGRAGRDGKNAFKVHCL